ncbi:kininogen-1 [Salminus brasiliensis]|uniref:kininogen-1 n=1 Tax=Salminus brasiliensis TaxID=930266 RepID=UPI003B82FF0F
MNGDRIHALLALTWLFYVGSQGQEETRLLCDDKSVQDVVDLVLTKHNKDFAGSDQLALYQVLEATKTKNETDEVMAVRYSARVSDCPAEGDKVWHQCDYLQDPSKPLFFCNANVLLKQTTEVISHDCMVQLLIVPTRAPTCLGCPIKLDVESEDLRESLSYSLAKANMMHNHMHFFILNSVGSATRQVIAGFRYRLRFDMQKSNCTKSEFKEVTEECHPDHEDKVFINCNSTVDVAPWRHEMPETHVQCAPGALPPTGFSVRRRPPGWSPLRNIHNFEVVTPVKPPKKDESSEESQEGKAPTAEAPVPAPRTVPPPKPRQEPTAAPTAPPSCPSKPWKEFNPVIANPTPPPPPPPSSNNTETESV